MAELLRKQNTEVHWKITICSCTLPLKSIYFAISSLPILQCHLLKKCLFVTLLFELIFKELYFALLFLSNVF